MKKKMLIFITIAVMIILAACGGSSKDEGEREVEDEVKTEAETEVETETEAETETRDTGAEMSFETTTVDGETITSEELFSNHEYTLVNCWASWCGPCIQELPELEALSKKFAEKNCAIIGVLMDGDTKEGLKDGKDILTTSGVTYTNIIPWKDFSSTIQLTAYPTSFFVDSKGQIVGEPIIGAMPDLYEEDLASLLGE